ncbi:hypothetical protein GUITHDRAFT_135839 [Guillardia theta CCMP2712]|uniref:J domain-containing protein n=2 Tax=Guillardia theta TaxID=55529 RepID=L1JN06_GUITC|nr:hypothetical protein GUITHDRAFT_135839 [Guillardia theta CCMP2712]EKX49664.1 hypothetical protein GUITHDRAFT_135839 [Guillardia theta CCMP2712]|eukprot:XP_005836644.1 hypothetical protein GUITHDRAFT_135839 [Guillardia theta CCMP2712]
MSKRKDDDEWGAGRERSRRRTGGGFKSSEQFASSMGEKYNQGGRESLRRDAEKLTQQASRGEWRSVFGLEGLELLELNGETRTEIIEIATAERRRLLKIWHPDKYGDLEAERTRATQSINQLWELASSVLFKDPPAPSNPSQQPQQHSQPQEPQQHPQHPQPSPHFSPPQPRPHHEPSHPGALQAVGAQFAGMQHQGMQSNGFSRDAFTARMLLGELASQNRLLCSENIRTYIGFAEYLSMNCEFQYMGTNRAVNHDVVSNRVRVNLTSLQDLGRYRDFGTISLIAVAHDDTSECGTKAKFYVIDGQHRLETMEELKRLRPNQPIHFQLRCKVVETYADAVHELISLQDCYQADPRCFFRALDENKVASLILDCSRSEWPKAFYEWDARSRMHASIQWEERRGKARADPARPSLSDGVLFDILRDTGILDAAMLLLREPNENRNSFLGDYGAVATAALEQIRVVNNKIKEAGEPGLKLGLAKSTWDKCKHPQFGYLGMYRHGDDNGRKILSLLQDCNLAMNQQPPEPEDEEPRFTPGDHVSIQGLCGKVEYNARIGIVRECLSTGRFQVELPDPRNRGTRTIIAVKPENMTLVLRNMNNAQVVPV